MRENLTIIYNLRLKRSTAATLATMAQHNDLNTSEVARLILERATSRWLARHPDAIRQEADGQASESRQEPCA